MHRIVIVKISDIPKDIDPLIKVFLQTTTYLTWGENDFWRKFFSVLPSGSGPEIFVPRSSENNEIVIDFSVLHV